MKSLLQFILRQHFLILFVFIETFSLLILVNNSFFQRAKFFNTTNVLSGEFYQKVSELTNYKNLRKINDELMQENIGLKNKISLLQSIDVYHSYFIPDSQNVNYKSISAKVINNSTNKQYNYITINKGSDQGVEVDMAVVSFNGIVGKVEAVSNKFSVVMSLLNLDFSLHVKLLKDNYGSLHWTGNGYSQAILSEIPHHVNFQKGDTIITSGFSDYYPEGIIVGTISDMQQEGNFYSIIVNLSTDFKNLSYLTIIENIHKKEQVELEKKIVHD